MNKKVFQFLLCFGVAILSGILPKFSVAGAKESKQPGSSQRNVSSLGNQPNIIMFITDDLGDWVTPLGYSQAKTPNLDRLATAGLNFTNAHAPGVFCAPSRTAIFTGMLASTTGCYENEVFFYDHPNLETIQMAFNEAGYNTYGAGKIYHHRSGYVDLRGWTRCEITIHACGLAGGNLLSLGFTVNSPGTWRKERGLER